MNFKPLLNSVAGDYVVQERVVTLTGGVKPLVDAAADRCLLWMINVSTSQQAVVSTNPGVTATTGIILAPNARLLQLTSMDAMGLVWVKWYGWSSVNQDILIHEVFYRPSR